MIVRNKERNAVGTLAEESVPALVVGVEKVATRELLARRRLRALKTLVERFRWGKRELLIVEMLQAAHEAGVTGANIPAQALREKVDGTSNAAATLSVILHREEHLIRWYRMVRADWSARQVRSDAILFVLVHGSTLRAVEDLYRIRHGQLAATIHDEITRLKMALDKAGTERA
jgi:hypothetical protein